MSHFVQQLPLNQYREVVKLDDPFLGGRGQAFDSCEKKQIIDNLSYWLAKEDRAKVNRWVPTKFATDRDLLRALLNIREPKPIDLTILNQLNHLLQAEARERGIIKAATLPPITDVIPGIQWANGEKFVLWQGDITLLEVDAIVNAANSDMLGCFEPLHACIDNAIHSAAGPQLREDCYKIMSLQKERELTGDAKITRAYNLPSKFVLHTVGPIVPRGTKVSQQQKDALASCYNSCLELAAQIEEIRSVAFCAISTGVFGFPKKEAAEIAVSTVNKWLDKNPNRFEQILFCVFAEEDYREYVRVFQGK